MEPQEGKIYIALNGKPYIGYYEVDEHGIMTVFSTFGKRSTPIASVEPKIFARMILKEMVDCEFFHVKAPKI